MAENNDKCQVQRPRECLNKSEIQRDSIYKDAKKRKSSHMKSCTQLIFT